MGVSGRGAVADFLSQRYGGTFRPIISTVTVGTAQVQACAYNPERMALTFVALGTNAIRALPLSGVTFAGGIHIGAAGGVISFDVFEDLVLPAYDWYAISDAVNQPLLVVEVVRDTETPETTP